MGEKNGKLSINSENMLPIIKKWLYSDHDIFIREQISNGCDAITKLKKLEGVGEYTPQKGNHYQIKVIVDPDEKTLKFIDNGIGMTEDEVVEYITQIAFSGASEFLEKYKGKTDNDQIIGHFGLGFYSAFMVADEVHIDTLSYLEGAKPVHWESDGESEYSISDGDRKEIGTEITLYLSDNCYEFCNEYRVREVLEKYCSFMPVEIYLEDVGKAAKARKEEQKKQAIENNNKRYEDAKKHLEDLKKEGKEPTEDEINATKAPAPYVEPKPLPINDIHPLWTKLPKDCSDEEYKLFYHKVFHDYKDPLFWIHLNMDYPLNLRGILFFPQLNTEYDALEADIKLYNNQVFIAENIKEVIPEYLMALKGVIDCPDLPLNVSRSALQNDGSVRKISDYISKKFTDKLAGMCKTDRENYEKNWNNISPFIKFGCIKDDKFADRMMDNILFKDLDDKLLTLEEYKEKNNIAKKEEEAKEAEAENAAETEGTKEASGNADGEISADSKDAKADSDSKASSESKSDDASKEPEKSTVYYVTDESQQAPYISMFRDHKKDAVILKDRIDNPFITRLEQRNSDLQFVRIDADLDSDLTNKKKVSKKLTESLTNIFRKHLGNEGLTVEVRNMKDHDVPAVLTLSEQNRRMQEMMKMYGMDAGGYGSQEVLILNAGNDLVKYIEENEDNDNTKLICAQIYDLASLSHRQLTPDEMSEFIKRSNKIMTLLAGK